MFLIPESLYSVQQTSLKGRGIFAKQEIPAGTVIGDYLGLMIRPGEENEENGLYDIWINDDLTVHADSNITGIHMINHSCAPNCAMYPYKGHTLYVALRHIFIEEELTVSYLLEPPDKDDNPCRHACHCDAVICHGTWHLSKIKTDQWTEFENEMQKLNPGVVAIDYGKEFPRLPAYPANVEDHPIYDLFADQHQPSIILNDAKVPPISELRKLLRDQGRSLKFTELNIIILGIMNNLIVSSGS